MFRDLKTKQIRNKWNFPRKASKMIIKSRRIASFVDFKIKNDILFIIKTTPLFEKLVRNVENEYKKFHENREPKIDNLEIAAINTSSSSDQAGYLKNSKFIDSYVGFKETQDLPFSITQELNGESDEDVRNVIFPARKVLKKSYFVSNSFSRETFHQIQRQHKIWWMTYGSSPGKYSISDHKTESFSKFVNIRSNVADSPMDVERVKLLSLKDCIKDKEVLNKFSARVPNRKKETVPDVIETTVDLQVASLALLLDAVNLSEDYTALHRRSAPYQIALLVNGTSSALVDLARYIELLVQQTNSNIEVLNESKSRINSKEEQRKCFEKFDMIGIPYSIILDDVALETGLFKLRNRNTTLSETIHLSDVNNYLIKVFTSG